MRKSLATNLFRHTVSVFPYLILVVLTLPIAGIAYTESAKLIGLRTIPVSVVGTGSMYPSLFWAKSEGGPEDENSIIIEEYRSTPHLYKRYDGISLFGKKYLASSINRGDMVAFQNDKTKAILQEENKDNQGGFIKRVIAVPGDRVELRDGFTYINSQLLSEPYIALPRSTYGGDFLKDCQVLTIPEDQYFVLGDNRKVSSDSRFELGLINLHDIAYILPLSEQQIYHSLWRDTSQDDNQMGQPTLDSQEFIVLVNEARSQKKLPLLKNVASLNKSSAQRGLKLLLDPSTSYDLKQSTKEAGYSNIVLGELVSYGHFSAKELLDNLLFNGQTAKQILNPEFSDLGISTVNLEVGGCPSQVIVGHLGGYIPADYDQSQLETWRNLAKNITSILPSWESAVGHEQVDQVKLASLLSILHRRLELAREIVSVMEQKLWLTEQQQAKIISDKSDATQADMLARDLNKE